MQVDGRCHCGRFSYTAEIDPDKVSLCHCTDCQTLSGSAYRVSVPAPAETFELRGGEPTIYLKTADSGRQRAHAFCPECGSPIYSAAPSETRTYSLRVGCLAQRADLPPRRRIWCRSALPWGTNVDRVPATDRQ